MKSCCKHSSKGCQRGQCMVEISTCSKTLFIGFIKRIESSGSDVLEFFFYETGTGTSLNGPPKVRCHGETSESASDKTEIPDVEFINHMAIKHFTSGERVVIWFKDKSRNARFWLLANKFVGIVLILLLLRSLGDIFRVKDKNNYLPSDESSVLSRKMVTGIEWRFIFAIWIDVISVRFLKRSSSTSPIQFCESDTYLKSLRRPLWTHFQFDSILKSNEPCTSDRQARCISSHSKINRPQ